MECPNCGHSTSDPFCPNCGQKRMDKRLSVKDIVKDGLSFMFSLESPLWRTLLMQFKNPGRLSREFISGKRSHYYRPFQYFIFAILVYFIIRGVFDFDPVTNAMKMQAGAPEELEQTKGIRAGYFMSRNVNYFLPLWAILLALFDYGFFFKSKFNLAERLAHSFYMVSHYIILGTLVIPFTEIDPRIDYAKFVILFVWTTSSITSFHRRQYWWTIPKAFLITLLSFMLYITVSFMTVLAFM